MNYGTIKSEVLSHIDGVAQPYYHYEIITKWWLDDEKANHIWKHSIIRIDRDGTVTLYEAFKQPGDWWDAYEEYMLDQVLTVPVGQSVRHRNRMSEQHQWIVRHCLA
jgi:hypothetical protein